MPSFAGNLLPSGTGLPHKKLEILGYHMVKTRSLYLTWPWIRTGSWQTDGRTDRQTDRIRIAIAYTRSQQYLPVQLWRVKKHSSLLSITLVDLTPLNWRFWAMMHGFVMFFGGTFFFNFSKHIRQISTLHEFPFCRDLYGMRKTKTLRLFMQHQNIPTY